MRNFSIFHDNHISMSIYLMAQSAHAHKILALVSLLCDHDKCLFQCIFVKVNAFNAH